MNGLTENQKQAIRIALLEFAGFKVEYHPQGHPLLYNLPNYPASLDACHAIEVKLTDIEHRKFRNWIEDIALQSSETSEEFHRESVSPRAEHRALALFRALNLGELGE